MKTTIMIVMACIAICESAFAQNPPCPVTTTGDVNESGSLTSADVIGLVNYAFKSGALPQPCEAAGDVNCDTSVTSADIIYMVNHIFKSGPEPCDVCALVNTQTWTCQVCLDPLPGLVGWWPGDGNANDIIGGNNLTDHGGIAFIPGYVADGFNFDGIDDYLELPSPTLQPALDGSFSFEFWFNSAIDMIARSNRGIATHYGPGFPSNAFGIYLAGNQSSTACLERVNTQNIRRYGHVAISFESPTNTGISICSDTPMNDGQWHHVASTYDGSAKTLTCYFDGQPGGFVPVSSTGVSVGPGAIQDTNLPSFNWAQPFFFGNHVNRFYPFELDEPAFYNRVLTASEIQAIHAAGSLGKCKP